MRKYLSSLLVGLTILLATACGDDGFKYSDYHCNLSVDNATHQDATLATAMDANAPGTFCIISSTRKGGALWFTFANNHGLSSESIFNAIDQRLESQKHIGLNGRLIIGYGNMDHPAHFYAYDGECPKCFQPNALPLKSYPLQINSEGIAECAACHLRFNLNLEGICINGSDRLITYRAASTGAWGHLQVY